MYSSKVFINKYMMILCLIALLLHSSLSYSDEGFCSSITYQSPSNEVEDIIYVFDEAYRCGKFANGDWWVSHGSRGSVTVTGIYPPAANGINGYQINPINTKYQSFDHRIRSYTSDLMPAFPLVISNSASVVKTTSVEAFQERCRPCLNSAAILTITKQPVADNTFRPGYYGNNKIFYSSIINVRNILSRYPESDIPSSYKTSFASIAKRYKNVQLDHIVGWTGRDAHPKYNMPDYGAKIATDNAVSVLRFLLDDFDINKPTHKSALINYLQMSIDFKTMADADVSWPANGGHGNGRKLPILFGALMLNDNSFYAAALKPIFSEDQQVYYSQKAGRVLYGQKCTVAQYWKLFVEGKGSRTCRDPYGYIDGSGPYIGFSYQLCCTAAPWKYTALATTLLGIKNAWSNDNFFQYVERWQEQGAWASPDPCAPYNGIPSDDGVKWGGTSCIPGSGRSIDKHGVNAGRGFYSDPIGEEMWRYYPRSPSRQ